ncbi:MAG: hypothetical protein HYR77_05525 [Ignavibacteria bacterium]|nr:hypothetical protein [Ignavibacteria bacterium]
MPYSVFGHLIFCYIDPGTGSMILQILLGGVAGLWMIIKLFGHRIKTMLGLSKKEEEPK